MANDATTSEAPSANPWEEQLIADLRANGGRPSDGPLKGHPLMLMWSTGAKSGERRRAILTYSRDGEDFIVAATAGGSQSDPSWLRNVKADPEVDLEVANEKLSATATEITGPERDRLWAQHVEQLPWFGDYPDKITERQIPMICLSRTAPAR